MAVTSKEALEWVDEKVFAKTGRHLNEAERVILDAAWEDIDYEAAANSSGYGVAHLHRNVGRLLWTTLRAVLPTQEKITKKRFRSIVERAIAEEAQALGHFNQGEADEEARARLQGQPPDVSQFWGRIQELDDLSQSIAQKRCIAITGVKGVGKSALAAKLMHRLLAQPEPPFDRFIWQSLSFSPSLQELTGGLLRLLHSGQGIEIELPEYPQANVTLLVESLKSQRCLIVLDGVEAVLLGPAEQATEYEVFLRRIAEEQHQSCLLITTQEPCEQLSKLELLKRPVQTLQLGGLNRKEATELLRSKGLKDEDRWIELIEGYQGNPLLLELAANRIQTFFGGSIAQTFLDHKTSLVSDPFQEFLNQRFGEQGRLSNVELRVMVYLAQELAKGANQIPVTKLFSDLSAATDAPISLPELIKALESLTRRALIGPGMDPTEAGTVAGPSFTLHSIIQQYILKDPLGLVSASIGYASAIHLSGANA